jgi:hypothetical protein
MDKIKIKSVKRNDFRRKTRGMNGGLKVEAGQLGNCPTSEKTTWPGYVMDLDFKDGDLMGLKSLSMKAWRSKR